MHRFFTIALVAATLVACSESTAPRLIEPEVARAVTSTFERTRVEENAVFPVPRGCTGEPVQWTLRQEITLHSVIDANGGFHGSYLFHDLGSSGIGLTTGALYRLSQVQDETFNVGSGALPINDTAIFLRRFISQGSLPNFRVTNIFHYTIDANGTMTAYHNTFDRVCD